MSKLQELARERNFNKFRLMGFQLNKIALTEDEIILFRAFKDAMLENWNRRSQTLGLKPKISEDE